MERKHTAMGNRIAILLLLAIVATACNPCKRAMRRGCYKSDTVEVTHTITVRDTIELPGDTVATYLNPDSLEVDRLHTLLDNAKFMITALRNKKGDIEYRVIEKPVKIPYEKKVPVVVRVPYLQPTPPETAVEKGRRYALNALACVGGLFVLWLLLFGKPKQRKE